MTKKEFIDWVTSHDPNRVWDFECMEVLEAQLADCIAESGSINLKDLLKIEI